MKTTFKEILARRLINVCESVTLPYRTPKTTLVNPDIDESVIELFRAETMDDSFKKMMGEVFSAIAKDDRFKRKTEPLFTQFTVVVPRAKGSNHSLPLNAPYIITHAIGHMLEPSGKNRSQRFVWTKDDIFPASPAQVIECVGTLTDAQWKALYTDEMFRPIMEETLDTEIDIPESWLGEG